MEPNPGRTQTPWARVRAVDPAVTPRKSCNRCGSDAILHFKADFDRTSFALPREEEDPTGDAEPIEVRQRVENDIFSCLGHAGDLAFAAAYTVMAGPAGAV
ncbi:hypothetical protein [Streptomyces violaceusniger]|uniref:Uncharacterized protein n=1 Tax=Streptomyces violaceusniger (strain Tu 4113) TaxID=653045 RepID=G2PHZ0_STRV4|nr:hypothetical protein [Streptomyces violaceusniger]AEM88941.1 hypothetical protein Strvi_0168 [Streptomyces violaceusniger Tu 4113]